MPKGQSPRQGSLAKLGKLTTDLKNATTPTKVQKVKTLLKAYTVGVKTTPKESESVKKLRSKIVAREKALLKNSNKLPADGKL